MCITIIVDLQNELRVLHRHPDGGAFNMEQLYNALLPHVPRAHLYAYNHLRRLGYLVRRIECEHQDALFMSCLEKECQIFMQNACQLLTGWRITGAHVA